MNDEPKLGDIAVVTTESNQQYVGVWTLAKGIGYYWRRLTLYPKILHLSDPDTSFRVIGRIYENQV